MRLIHLAYLGRLLPKVVKRHLLRSWNGLLGWEQGIYERSLYAHFIKQGDLVFDIGANYGGKSATFLSLGAHVVAVEPNPTCIESLLKRFVSEIATGRLVVLPVAIGPSKGRTQLRQFSLDGSNATASDLFEGALRREL